MSVMHVTNGMKDHNQHNMTQEELDIELMITTRYTKMPDCVRSPTAHIRIYRETIKGVTTETLEQLFVMGLINHFGLQYRS